MNELRDVFTKYKAVVFFDTETTGLEAESCQIIELAAIRVEKTERGTLRMADSADVFVKPPEGERIPQKIVELTGITDERLENEGITEAEAAARFTELISDGPVLLVAHNAQFDLLFTAEMLRRHGNGGPEALKAADYLDSLTVYKDRRAYPHKLANAILTYKLEDKVQNMELSITKIGVDNGLRRMNRLEKQSFEFRWVQNVVKSDGSTATEGCKAFVRTMPGSFPELGVEVGSATEAENTYNVTRLQIYANGVEICCVDRLAQILRINGKDYMSQINNLL